MAANSVRLFDGSAFSILTGNATAGIYVVGPRWEYCVDGDGNFFLSKGPTASTTGTQLRDVKLAGGDFVAHVK